MWWMDVRVGSSFPQDFTVYRKRKKIGTITYLYNGMVGRRRLQQHQLGMEEQDCQNSPTAQTFLTKTLAHLFILKYIITTPVQYT